MDNIWGADLADMQIIGKYNKKYIFMLFFIDVSSKDSWIIRSKDKKPEKKILKHDFYKRSMR